MQDKIKAKINSKDWKFHELLKLKNLSISKSKLSIDDVIKLSNLAENYSISELIDNCLVKNKKKSQKFSMKIIFR